MDFPFVLRRLFGVPDKKLSAGTQPGVTVFNGATMYTNADALSISSVYRCVSAIGNAVGGMSLRCYRRKGDGYTEDTTTSLGGLLLVSPDGERTIAEFMCQLMSDVHMFGNGLIVIHRSMGEVQRLELANPAVVSTTNGGYMVGSRYYPEADCIHIRNIYVDRETGMGISTLRYAFDTLNLSKTADNETSGVITGNGRARGIFTSSESTLGMGAGASANQNIEVDRVEKELASGKSLSYVPGDLKFIQFAMNPADTQLQEVRRMSVIDICRFFSVHPEKLYAAQASNYKASMEAQANFRKDSVFPWCRRIAQAFTMKLIEKDLWGRFFIDFDYKEALLGDPDGQINLYTKLFNIGGVTVNEVRDIMRMERLPGGDVTIMDNKTALGMIKGGGDEG